MYDVVVVGAGPVGCRVAELTAKRGLKTAIIDKKKEVGLPVQCAGLVSHRLKTLLPDLPDNIILNKVSRAKFFSNSTNFELKSKKPVYVIDRERLDKFLFHKAKKAGADTGMPILFKDFNKQSKEGEESLILETSEGKMQTKLLVGADGPMSIVATKAGLRRPANMLTGVQTTVATKEIFDPDAVELFFGSTITPDFFGWVVPLSANSARIGLAAKRGATTYLKRFVEKRRGGEIKAHAVKPDVAGKINFGLMSSTATERVLVVGDAAAHVKPFSGGGLIYGLIGAGYAANACIKAVHENNFSTEFLRREYDEKWKWHLQKPIKRGLTLRKLLFGSDRKMNFLLSIAGKLKFILQRLDIDLL